MKNILIITFSSLTLLSCVLFGFDGTMSPGKLEWAEGDELSVQRNIWTDPFGTTDMTHHCINDATASTAIEYCQKRGKYAYYKEHMLVNQCNFYCYTEDELPVKSTKLYGTSEMEWTNYGGASYYVAKPVKIDWLGVAAGLDAMNQGIYGAEPSGYIDLGYGSNSNTKGITKVCSYNCAGSAYSITIGAAEICPLSPPCDSNASVSNYDLSAGSTACSNTSEYIKGANKICSYDCVGSAHAITIGAAESCPISVNR